MTLPLARPAPQRRRRGALRRLLGSAEEGRGARSGKSGGWLLLVCLAITFANFAVWSWATPLLASPDAPTHVARAASVARGQLIGSTVGSDRSPLTEVTIPAVFAQDPPVPECFEFHPTVPASCAPPLPTSTQIVPVDTYVGRYPPLYYLVTGIPSLFAESARGVYLMRLVASLLDALFVSLALFAVARWSRHKVMLVAVLAAATPQVWFLGSVVNPSGFEICTAICVWTSGAVLVLEHAHDPPPGLVAVVGISLAALVLTRPLSPLWCAVAVVILAIAGGWSRVRALLANRSVQWTIPPLAACGAFAMWWIVSQHSTNVVPSTTRVPRSEPLTRVALAIVEHWGFWSEQLVGVFGWLDTFSPRPTYAIWGVVVGGAVLFGLVRAGARQKLALVLLVAVVFVTPVAIVSSQIYRLGFVWQGKDILPLAVGIPIVATAVGVERALRRPWRKATVVTCASVCAALGVADLAAFAEALRRYAVGVDGPIDFLSGPWHPPLGNVPVLAAAVASVAVLAIGVAIGVARSRSSDAPLPSRSPKAVL